jgi:hypothetical protein
MGPPTVELLIKMREKEGDCYVAVIAEDIAGCSHGVSVAGRISWLVCEDVLHHTNHVSPLEYTEYTRAGRWTKHLLPTPTKGVLMH